MPVPQEMNFIVEQASCLLSENGATSQVKSSSIVEIGLGESQVFNYVILLK
ncbi:hypothetical protein [Microcoleus vaginatus]|uniref:hypothetical protein n=1 Tax=Microcoleus vaginatus TaxID=119532 RepID=UPI001F601F30